MALEQWNPNIKTPGIRKHTGEYYNPQGFPGGPEGDFIMPDWQAINKSWQKGMNSMMTGVMAMAQAQRKRDEDRQAKNDGFEDLDFIAAAGIDAQNQKILTDWVENKLSGLRSKHGADAGFGDLNQRSQRKWLKEAKQLGGVRQALIKHAEQYNQNNDIDYSALNLKGDTAEFLDQMFTTPGAIQKIEERQGVQGITYKDSKGETQWIPVDEIVASVGIYQDAGKAKSESLKGMKGLVDTYKSQIQKIAADPGTPESKVERYKAAERALNNSIDKYAINDRDRAFIFNNFIGDNPDTRDTRYIKFDPKSEDMMNAYDEGFKNFVHEKWSLDEFKKALSNKYEKDPTTGKNIGQEKGILHQEKQGKTISRIFQGTTTMTGEEGNQTPGMTKTGDLIGVDIDVQGSPKEIRGVTFDQDTKKLELSIHGKYFTGEALYQSVKEDVNGNPIETAKVYVEVGEKGSGIYKVAKTQPKYGIETKKYDLNNPVDFEKLYNDLGLAGSKAQGTIGALFGTKGLERAEKEFLNDNYASILEGTTTTKEGKDIFTPKNKKWYDRILNNEALNLHITELIKNQKLVGPKWSEIAIKLTQKATERGW